MSYTKGTWSWNRGGEHSGGISLSTDLRSERSGSLVLDYCHNSDPVRQDIDLVAVPMRFGGVRWWARCPIWGHKCGTLVFSARYRKFVSVKASGYAYATQTEAPLDRIRSRAAKLEKRYKALSKYTRTDTRKRLYDQWWLYENHADMLFEDVAARFMGRMLGYEATLDRLKASKARKSG